MERVLTVSEAARQLGRSERWLREAEARGKIPKARRDLNGWRVYTEEDLERLRQLLVPGLVAGAESSET
jgi:DNA-binding transcriptional MerR regulator